MKIICTSDLHGNLPDIKENFDILFICGDLCPAHDHYYSYQKEWLENEFKDWILELPYKDEASKVVVVPGNHDFILERDRSKYQEIERLTEYRLKILCNEVYEYESLKIFGTPYCKLYGNWAFMREPEILQTKYSDCPEGIDIFISHDAPDLNDLGLIQIGPQSGINAGNPVLAKIIQERRPRLFFCGHIHSGNHGFIQDSCGTWMCNVSYINEHYIPAYNLFTFDYNLDTKEIENPKYLEVECKYRY